MRGPEPIERNDPDIAEILRNVGDQLDRLVPITARFANQHDRYPGSQLTKRRSSVSRSCNLTNYCH